MAGLCKKCKKDADIEITFRIESNGEYTEKACFDHTKNVWDEETAKEGVSFLTTENIKAVDRLSRRN